MLRLLSLTAALLFLATASPAQDADLKAILKKAIEAHGGEKALVKMTAATAKYTGTLVLMGARVEVSGEMAYQKPDKVKNAMALEIGGKKIEVVTVFDGKKLYVAADGKTMEIDDEKVLKDTRESILVEGAGSLVDYLKEPYTLSALGEVKVKGNDTVGIRVSRKGLRDINLFFDKKTHLVVKTEMNSYDPPTAQDVNQEKFFTAYQEKGGLKVGKSIEILRDGKEFMKMEITEAESLEKLDDSIFAKP